MSLNKTVIAEQLSSDTYDNINFDKLHTIGVYYFAEILEENKKLSRKTFIFNWLSYMSRGKRYAKLVQGDTLIDAIKKLLLNCDETFEVLAIYCDVIDNPQSLDKQKKDMFCEMIFLETLCHTYSCYGTNPDFSEQYKEFLAKYLDKAADIFLEFGSSENFGVDIFDVEKMMIII